MMLFRLIFVFSFLFLTNILSAQDTIYLSDSILPTTKGFERNPVTLAARLTQNKQGDKEKFNAIFLWVVKNLSYDYGLYLSKSGSTSPDIKRILKRKKGVCGDYAGLMDTLCTLAGLQTASVFGYSKDDLFDVKDSVYMENHVWNAVKLDNLWYVYDATWSSGMYRPEYRKLSKLIFNLETKLLSKQKLQTFEFNESDNVCGTPVTTKKEAVVLPQPYRFLFQVLSLYRKRVHSVFVRVDEPYYYLSSPETFAITHFPDNPYWSLTSSIKSIKDFEGDSAYYHLNKEMLLNQKRNGRTCGECDAYFGLDEMDKLKQFKNNTKLFNKRNAFVPARVNYSISRIFYEESLPETDSASKVALIDSSLLYISQARSGMLETIRMVNKEYKEQRAKNRLKMQLLKTENKTHIKYLKALAAIMEKNRIEMKKFMAKKRKATRLLMNEKRELERLPNTFSKEQTNFKNKAHLEEISKSAHVKMKLLDSLNTGIGYFINQFSYTTNKLSDNLWDKIGMQDSLSRLFYVSANMRSMYWIDNYDKIMALKRKEIMDVRNKYSQGVEVGISMLSDSVANVGEQLFNLMETRNKILTQTAKFINILERNELLPTDTLHNFIVANTSKIQEELCMINGNASALSSALNGYRTFTHNQERVIETIKLEDREEYERFRMINGEIVRRTGKYKNIPAQNLIIISQTRKVVRESKRDYIKKLREERKKKK